MLYLLYEIRFSFGQLPDWAKKQMKGESASSSPVPTKRPSVALPQGKWSERVEQSTGPLTIKSFYHSDTVVPTPFARPQPQPQGMSCGFQINFNLEMYFDADGL